MQVWDPGSYVNGANAPANTGLLWHAIDSKIPLSGFVSPLFYYAPRLGLAYDIFGTGKTVFRGGFAVYRYQATSETASAGNGPAGVLRIHDTYRLQRLCEYRQLYSALQRQPERDWELQHRRRHAAGRQPRPIHQ